MIFIGKYSSKRWIQVEIVDYGNEMANYVKIENGFASLSFYISKNFVEMLKYLTYWSRIPYELSLIQIELEGN